MNLGVSLRNGGGDLMTRVSSEEAGLRQVFQSPTEWYGNYVTKRNWRRSLDQEVRREGNELFVPFAGSEATSPFPTLPVTSSPITLEFTARRDNGQTAFICGTTSTLYRYYAFEDQDILEDDIVEAGIIGTISDGIWLIIGTGFSTVYNHRWEAINVGGKAIFNNGVELPQSYDLGEFAVRPIYELREMGVAFVGTIMELAGCLLCMDVATIHENYLQTVMLNIGYGQFSIGQQANYDRVGYLVMWSDPVGPTRWGASVPGAITAGLTTLTLDYDVTSIQPGDAIRVVGAGLDGGDLLTTLGFKNGGAVWVVTDPAETTVTDAAVAKRDAASLISGSYPLLDDSTSIVRGVKLGDQALIAKTSGFIVAQFTGDRARPFTFERVYGTESGDDTVYYRWTLVAVGKEYVLYAGKKDFYRFDLVSRIPRLHPKLLLCSNLFYENADITKFEEVFAADNGLTAEIWISIPWNASDCMLCFDYLFNTVSTVTELYTAAATVDRPVALVEPSYSAHPETWFVMAAANATLLRSNLTLWTRRGATYVSDLLMGLSDFGDPMNEKHINQYVLLPASQSPDTPVTLNFLTVRNPSETAADISGSPTVMATPRTKNTVYLHTLAHLIQERIRVSSSANFRMSRRVWAVGRVGSASVVRR